MAIKFQNLLFLLFVLLLSNCSESTTGVTPARDFKYTAFDSSGEKIVEGRFNFNFQDSTSFSFEGEWHFEKVGNPQNIGPQVGSGSLVANLEGEEIFIDLNPNFADNNVVLTGNYTGNKISGDWTWITFVGETNRGNFEAIEK